jgi:hypothetical protein
VILLVEPNEVPPILLYHVFEHELHILPLYNYEAVGKCREFRLCLRRGVALDFEIRPVLEAKVRNPPSLAPLKRVREGIPVALEPHAFIERVDDKGEFVTAVTPVALVATLLFRDLTLLCTGRAADGVLQQRVSAVGVPQLQVSCAGPRSRA